MERAYSVACLAKWFPSTDVQPDNAGPAIRSAVRDSIEEPFTNRGNGAREQVAVCTRLTLAGFLEENGSPTTLVQDDPLANGDDERIRQVVHGAENSPPTTS